MIENWKDLGRFPLAEGQWQVRRPPWNRTTAGLAAVERLVGKWNSFDPVTVATPESSHFLPPICIDGLAQRVHAALLRRQAQVLLVLAVFCLAVTTAAALHLGNAKLPSLGWIFACFIVFFGADYLLVLRRIERVRDRALFIHWLHQSGRRTVLPFAAAMIVAGGAQWWLQQRLGGFESLVRAYGTLYSATEGGEWWRYFTGPWLHSGLVHWVNNLMMLCVATGLATGLGRRRRETAAVLVGTAVLATLVAEYLAGAGRPDAIVGISGGIFGLFGWCTAWFFLHRQRFPASLWATVLSFVALNLGTTYLLVPNSSGLAHVGGFAAGALIALVQLVGSGRLPRGA
jgi:membrane associated rhomboid family serine protease